MKNLLGVCIQLIGMGFCYILVEIMGGIERPPPQGLEGIEEA